MTHRPGTRLLAFLLPVAALLLPAPAHAERVVTDDAAGDVVSTNTVVGPSSTGEELVPAPDHTTSDLTRVSIDHRASRLTVTASVRELSSSPFRQSLTMRVRTPDRAWYVVVERSNRHTTAAVHGRPGGSPCRGARASSAPTTDRLAVTVPTSCLGDPRWVQVAMVLVDLGVVHDPATGDRMTAAVDDPFAVGFAPDAQPAYGPRVRRG